MVRVNRQQAIDKLEGIITSGRTTAMTALSDIQREWEERRDLIVRPSAIDFHVGEDGVQLLVVNQEREEMLRLSPTNHAYRQMLEKSAVPKPFAEKLLQLGEYDLLRANLNKLFAKISPHGALVRHVGPTLKGFLSTMFKTMDAAPVFQGFAEEALRREYVPYGGRATDMRYQLRFLHPQVFEPTPGEFVVYGLGLTTGDYGSVANTMELTVLRILCDNLAVGFDVFRKVHIGRRFEGEGDVIAISKRTRELDTRTVVSMTRDAVTGAFQYFQPLNEAISASAEKKPDVNGTLSTLQKRGLKKEIIEAAKKMYETEMPIEALPKGESAWRLSNVLSLLAKSESGDQAVELESAAFDVLGIEKIRAA